MMTVVFMMTIMLVRVLAAVLVNRGDCEDGGATRIDALTRVPSLNTRLVALKQHTRNINHQPNAPMYIGTTTWENRKTIIRQS